MVHEVIVYIHGVMGSAEGRLHTPEYEALHNGVGARLPDNSVWNANRPCYVEWGWDHDQSGKGGHRLLTRAQSGFGETILKKLNAALSWTWNPARIVLNWLRPQMIFGFSDIFYYVSEDGKQAVRLGVAEQICHHLEQLTTQAESSESDPISLTLIGHSAGAVIAFDFAFYLFFEHSSGEPHDYLKCENGPQQSAEVTARTMAVDYQIRRLHELAQSGRLRIRRLITLGSPLAMLTFRSQAVVELMARGERLDPSWNGLTQNPPTFGQSLANPRWINVWDKDDPVAWPVEPLMRDSLAVSDDNDTEAAEANRNVVRDVHLNIDRRICKAHGGYWHHRDVHRQIADTW